MQAFKKKQSCYKFLIFSVSLLKTLIEGTRDLCIEEIRILICLNFSTKMLVFTAEKLPACLPRGIML